jgi:Zinc finger, C2H2 type
VELDDSIPYTCDACVNKLTEFQSLRSQIRESDRILKNAFTGGTEAPEATMIMPEPASQMADDASVFEIAQIKQEPLASHSDIESEDALLGMKVEFLDADHELIATLADLTPRSKKVRNPPPAKPDGFMCCMCPKTFQTKAEQLQHATTEHTKYRYAYQTVEIADSKECDMCGRKFPNEQRLRNHQFRFTTYQQCDLCGEILPNNSTHVMQKHLKDHHSGKKTGRGIKPKKKPKFQCDICKKKFHAKKSLENHMEEHNGTDFICPECGKVKRSLVSFKNHMKLHQLKKQEPKFACKFCPKKFYSERRVECHTRIHTGKFWAKRYGPL